MRRPDPPIASGRARRIPAIWRWSLVADSDIATGRLLGRVLPAEGFRVGTAGSAKAVLQCVASNRPDAIVLGGDLPDMTAFELIARLHASAGPPLLMLIAGTRDDMVRALDAGAGDCMPKPFLVGELAARLRKLVRRRLMNQGFVTSIRTETLDIDCVRWRVCLRGVEIRLSAREYAVMRMLVEDIGKVVSIADLLSRVWWSRPAATAWPIRPVVRNLRRKLDLGAGSPVRLLSVQQLGYRLVVPSHAVAGGGDGP
jgi:two-component system KDP operon response regulator KdpE